MSQTTAASARCSEAWKTARKYVSSHADAGGAAAAIIAMDAALAPTAKAPAVSEADWSLDAAKVAAGAASIVDVMMGGDLSWRARLNDNDFLESSDWQMAMEYSFAALRAASGDIIIQSAAQGGGTDAPAADREAWTCMGRRQSLPEPADCNWPDCGCDPHATKIIESLIEQGWREPPAPLPWNAFANRSYEPVERRAKEIYDAFEYDGVGTKPAWVNGGNGIKQDEARAIARNALHASTSAAEGK
jgi:hypothetical protein